MDKLKMITQEIWDLVEEFIKDGWEFDLLWTDWKKEGNFRWEADFTRRLDNGLWDNHEEGISKDDPNIAIKNAYNNIKTGKRLKKNG